MVKPMRMMCWCKQATAVSHAVQCANCKWLVAQFGKDRAQILAARNSVSVMQPTLQEFMRAVHQG